MDRVQAARLLGVSEQAEPDLVRRAYRTWARIAHPDVGGDPEHFALLVSARRTLLRPNATDHAPMPIPEPRLPLSAVIHKPSRVPMLVASAALCLALVALPRFGVSLVVSALIAGGATAAWSWWATRSSLRTDADAGHRITMLALTWLPLVVAQVTLAAALGVAIINNLPVLALPFVAVVGSVNAGAGLWRPAR